MRYRTNGSWRKSIINKRPDQVFMESVLHSE